jgi:hypothetical protein
MPSYKQIRPRKYQVIIKHDVDERKIGSLVLTDKLLGAEEIGFGTGKVLKIGDKVLDFLNRGRQSLLTESDLTSQRVMYRQYLSNAWKFDKEDNQVICMIHVHDLVGLVPETVSVTSL